MTRILIVFALLTTLAGCQPSDEQVQAQMAKYALKNPTVAPTASPATSTTAGEEAPPSDDEVPIPTTAASTEPPPQAEKNGRGPIAVLEDNVFEFGTMEPYQSRQHTFVIRNDGDAPLELRAGTSSCKCTLGEVGTERIPPGEEGTVVLTWKSTDRKELFAHEAEVLTNDPANPILLCRVTGQIKSTFTIDPPGFSFAGMDPGAAADATVLLSSEVWNDFAIEDIRCEMEGLTWTVEPLTEGEREQLKAKSGYRLTASVPDDLPRGYFQNTLKMHVRPEEESRRLLELPINGNVKRRVSIYGRGIDSTGRVTLGKIPAGKGMKKYFTVKVRDREPVLEIKDISVEPDYVGVQFLQNEKLKKPGHYRMLIEIPPSAPLGNYMGQPAKLAVSFTNPRFDDVNLNLEFAIVGDVDF